MSVKIEDVDVRAEPNSGAEVNVMDYTNLKHWQISPEWNLHYNQAE